ncbi:MAG: DNA-binding response regulator [Bacteroidetes bacterium]|nr:MAG: DNA-binding response regulator [Bacteroidota bacterium]
MIKVAIAEDIPQLADALKEKVELAPELKVKHVATNGKKLINYLNKDHNLDVILMDINMPEMDGIEATKYITARWPQIKIIMCTVFSDEQNLFESIMNGATGYLLKDEPPAKIHKSIYEAIEGGAPMSREIAKKSLMLIRRAKPVKSTDFAKEYKLTPREIEILEHLSKGNSYEQIADNLYISYGTVRKHVENCYRKLRVHSKLEAINKIDKKGLF